MNYEQYFSKIQNTVQGRHAMGETLENYVFEKKYRASGFAEKGLSIEEFKSLRKEQLSQMHEAYILLNQGKYNRLMGPRDANDTSIEAARRVTGKNQTYNTGLLAIDNDDIYLASALASMEYTEIPYSQLPSYTVSNIVDSVEAMRALAEYNLQGKISLPNICFGTDALKRECNKATRGFNKEMFQDFAYESQDNGIIQKVARAFDKFLHPEKEKYNPNRFGNKEIETERE